MEPIRPKVDAFLLDWLRRAPLRKKCFFEQSDGNCRLTSVFACELSETYNLWRQALGPFAETIAHVLWTTTSRPMKAKAPATRLTQRRKREAKGIPTPVPVTPIALIVPKAVRCNAHDHIAQARRADSQRRQATALKAWNPVSKPEWLNEVFYREHIRPRLAGITVSAIVSALSVSEPYATKIRACRCVPHPRHWLRLARLVAISV